MKHLLHHKPLIIWLFTFFICWATSAQAQIEEHSHWSTELAETELAVGDEVELIIHVKIDAGWYLYSNDWDPNSFKMGAPMLTEFQYEDNGTYELIGETRPIGTKEKYDDIFQGTYTYFKKKAEFRQTVKVLCKDFDVKALVTGQVCTDAGMCIPFEYDLPTKKDRWQKSVKISGSGNCGSTGQVAPDSKEKVAEKSEKIPNNEGKLAEKSTTSNKSQNTPPDEQASADQTPPSASPLPQIKEDEKAPRPVVTESDQTDDQNAGMAWFMVLAFLSGLAAIFTPCVFPMIPLTVSFFSSKKKIHALFYSLSIIGIYTIFGAILSPLLGPAAAYLISTHWLPNAIFFLVFVIFALSFFGLFEIVLPSSLVNKMDKNADKGGLAGVFFMAFTLVLVSFSCTGPIVGTILIESAGGQVIKPMAGMFAFSLAFALPFGTFAFFPSLMNGLPKSGGWLNSVKVTLGFIELALSLKFLSMIDLIYHFGILDRHINIAIWITIAAFAGLYFLGKIRLPHDSPSEKISVAGMLLSLACFSFVVYLLPGMFGAPLKALSGVLPPSTTSSFDMAKVVRTQTQLVLENNNLAKSEDLMGKKPKYSEFLEIPHGLHGYFDYDEGMQVAKALGKPVFIDFTGHSCANCRRMEDNVWVQPEVMSRLKNDYVMIALYCDESKLKPESEWYVSEKDGRMKKSIGQQNLDFEMTFFNKNAQPLYVLLDNEGRTLAKPRGFTEDVKTYVKFLDEGLKEYEKRQQELAELD